MLPHFDCWYCRNAFGGKTTLSWQERFLKQQQIFFVLSHTHFSFCKVSISLRWFIFCVCSRLTARISAIKLLMQRQKNPIIVVYDVCCFRRLCRKSCVTYFWNATCLSSLGWIYSWLFLTFFDYPTYLDGVIGNLDQYHQYH